MHGKPAARHLLQRLRPPKREEALQDGAQDVWGQLHACWEVSVRGQQQLNGGGQQPGPRTVAAAWAALMPRLRSQWCRLELKGDSAADRIGLRLLTGLLRMPLCSTLSDPHKACAAAARPAAGPRAAWGPEGAFGPSDCRTATQAHPIAMQTIPSSLCFAQARLRCSRPTPAPSTHRCAAALALNGAAARQQAPGCLSKLPPLPPPAAQRSLPCATPSSAGLPSPAPAHHAARHNAAAGPGGLCGGPRADGPLPH